jgi:non-ribosomal peptide synthetase-like protein
MAPQQDRPGERPERAGRTARTGPLPVVPDGGPALYPVEPAPAPRTLVDILQATAAAHPDAVGLEGHGPHGPEALTYASLLERVEQTAQGLRAHGIGPGDRVGLRIPSGTTDLYIALLATLVAGAAYVPVDWDDPPSRAETVFSEAEVAAVVGKDLQITPTPGAVPGGRTGTPTPQDDAWIIFTSGTTGLPKGVAITHRSAAALVDAEAQMYLQDSPLRPGDRVMAGLAVSFDASCEEMWLAWRHGAALVAAPREVVRSGPDLGAWIAQKQITAISTVPTLAALWPDDALAGVRLLIFGGEACPPELIARLAVHGREVWNTYGPTEATVIASGAIMRPGQQVRIGLAVPGWELAVVDEEGQPVRWGGTGELVIGGVGLGRYLDPAKDAEKYAPLPSLGWERCYRTGDMVVAEPEGLVFAGRIDDQVKIGGKRIELGEVDAHLTAMPGVRAGAAAVQRTDSGTPVLVGYLMPETGAELDLDQIRALLAQRLPGGMTPSLAVLEELPLKSSGKTDRKALPWPLEASEDIPDLPEQLHWLGERWTEVLGPVPLTGESDFFALGGSSVAVAQLVTAVRERHPQLEFAQVYAHPTLAGMAQVLEGMQDTGPRAERPQPAPMPRWTGALQTAWVLALSGVAGLRYVVGAALAVWALAVFFDAGWVQAPPLLPALIGWLVLFSTPGRLYSTALLVRVLNHGLRPGRYRRGGATHLRVWAADRAIAQANLVHLLGGPAAVHLHRLFGTKVGRHAHLDHIPSATGLVRIGAGASVGAEADLHGHWVEGGTFVLGEVVVGEHARVGARSILLPGARVGTGAEIQVGSRVTGSIPAGEYWGGSPIRPLGQAGTTWPAEDPRSAAGVRAWPVAVAALFQWLTLGLLSVLPLVCLLPWSLLALAPLRGATDFRDILPVMGLWVPPVMVAAVVSWLLLVSGLVRLWALAVKPGFYPAYSLQAWAVWSIQNVMRRTLTSTYPVYASSATPWLLRLMGARIGRNVEVSTVETIPHLTFVEDGAFLADHSMAAVPRVGFGWVHIGTTMIGRGSFVGNSAIVGADRDLPDDALVAVLGSAPHRPDPGTSWLGREATSIPRVKVAAEASATFDPPRRLKLMRWGVELCRFIPAFIVGWLDIAVVYALATVYMGASGQGEDPLRGVIVACVASVPIALAASLLASAGPVLFKWALVGEFVPQDRPLYSSFVWRNELMDAFVEVLAVPSLIRVGLGSPVLTMWARWMGVEVGRSAWVESWWLPETDLVSIGDNATVNRGTVLQTHLFHDRVMTMQPVRLEAGATLGPNSFMLPGSTLGECTTIRPGSLVLREDTVPGHSDWSGNPIRVVQDSPAAAASGDTAARARARADGTDEQGRPSTGPIPVQTVPARTAGPEESAT